MRAKGSTLIDDRQGLVVASDVRPLHTTQHVSPSIRATKPTSVIDGSGRTTRCAGFEVSQRKRKLNEPAVDFTTPFTRVDTVLLGRHSYELLRRQPTAAPWPAGARVHVISRTLRPADYPTVTIVRLAAPRGAG